MSITDREHRELCAKLDGLEKQHAKVCRANSDLADKAVEWERAKRELAEAKARVAEQLDVLKSCAGLAARLEKTEDTILALQEIAWARIKLGGSAYTSAAVDRFQKMSNRLEDHRDLMDAKLAADDFAKKFNCP